MEKDHWVGWENVERNMGRILVSEGTGDTEKADKEAIFASSGRRVAIEIWAGM